MSRPLVWAVQVILAGLVAWFAGVALVRNWDELRTLDLVFAIDLRLLSLAAICVFVAYALLIEAWRRMILGWDQSLPYLQAIRIWCVSNMGRYLPGKIWSVAGLVVMAQRVGVSGWAATGSALAMQVLAVGTGAVVVAVTAPTALSALQAAAALLITTAVVVILVSEELTAPLIRLVRPDAEWRSLSIGGAVFGAVSTLVAWLVYGVAFWLLARGLLPETDLTLRAAIGVFAAGYVVGLLAIFAPGGIGVREAVFVALLAPTGGASSAVALAVASRLLLTLTEITAALIALGLGQGRKEDGL